MARKRKTRLPTTHANGNGRGKPPDTLSAATVPPTPSGGGLRYVWHGKTAGVRVTEDTALTLGAVWGCVRVITEDLAGLPWHVYQWRAAGRGNDLAEDDPADWLLHFQANPETPAFQWREVMLAWALTWGNGYAEVERDAVGRPVWLWQLSPDRVQPDRFRGRVIYDVHNESGPNTVLEAGDVYHLRGLGFDGLVGYPVVRLAGRAIGLGVALESFASDFYENDATPGGVLKHPGRLRDQARSNLKADWAARHSSRGGRRTVAVLEEGMSWEQTGLPPEDTQLIQQRQFTPAEICRFFRVKPHKIADLSRSTYSNIEDENRSHVTDTLLPWARRLEGEANVKLFGRNTRTKRFTKLNFMGFLRADVAARGQWYTSMLDRGVFSINDVRELEDMNPIGPDGDRRFVQGNMQLLADVGKTPGPPPASTPPGAGGEKGDGPVDGEGGDTGDGETDTGAASNAE